MCVAIPLQQLAQTHLAVPTHIAKGETNLRDLPLVAYENSLARPIHGVEHPGSAVGARGHKPRTRGVKADI